MLTNKPNRILLLLAITTGLLVEARTGLWAADTDLLPPQLTKDQRDNLQRFLQQHEKPARFLPTDARVVGTPPAGVEAKPEKPPTQPIKQYVAQIVSHRPVPGQEEVKRVDVYYYRPNPEKGKPGVTVLHTVDLTTGKQVGQTELLWSRHTPLAREELGEAVSMAQEKSPAVQELYKGREKTAVRWEYLQLMLTRKHGPHEPGDRVVRLVFSAAPLENQPAPAPVRVLVNLTRGAVVPDER
jgi:hypothetical protein